MTGKEAIQSFVQAAREQKQTNETFREASKANTAAAKATLDAWITLSALIKSGQIIPGIYQIGNEEGITITSMNVLPTIKPVFELS